MAETLVERKSDKGEKKRKKKKRGRRLVLALLLVALFIPMCGRQPKSGQRQGVCRPETTASWVIPIGQAYRVTAKFGSRIHPVTGKADVHTGIDLASMSRQAPVLAATAGTVSRVANTGNASYGRWIEITHDGGVSTRYAHLSRTDVKVGDTVTAGQQIGVEGASGGVTGPHLHFEIRINSHAVDPIPAMAERGLKFDGKPGSATAPSGNSGPALTPEQVKEILPNPAGTDRSSSLNPEQIARATAIVEEGQKLGLPPRAWAIALITALQESTLGADPTTTRPNGDHDVGVFQQRAIVAWYADGKTEAENVEILNDVRYAARTFYLGHDVSPEAFRLNPSGAAGSPGYHLKGVVNIRNWESLPLWQVAQAVQVSAFPLYYAKHEATVAGLLPRLNLSPNNTGCLPSPGDEELPSDSGERVAALAMTQLGVPYSWGGGDKNGPSTGHCCSPGGQNGAEIIGFDCSGLVLWAWAQVGVTLPHQSDAQRKLVTSVTPSDIRAGDLLFFPGHVGLADGKGGMIEAPRPGIGVRVTPDVLHDSYYGPRFTGAGRPTTTKG